MASPGDHASAGAERRHGFRADVHALAPLSGWGWGLRPLRRLRGRVAGGEGLLGRAADIVVLRLTTRRSCRGGLAAAELPAARARRATCHTCHAPVGAARHLDCGLSALAARLAADANLLRQRLVGFG